MLPYAVERAARGLAATSVVGAYPGHNTESYARIEENGFRRVRESPLSTFSIDVDRASYANVRRFIQAGERPPADAVRIEEMINYFPYEWGGAAGDQPFEVLTEVWDAPWKPEHRLVRIGLRAPSVDTEDLPPSNLVFLMDVSGSMSSPDKLPLLKKAFALLTEQLRPQDRVAIVVYAGAAGLVLPPTPGDRRARILSA
ncbi:MAG: VWA domain-containing protein, partial [Gemmatimonadales bacterium]|nr:VWA domain-containing protein [Gemmatimonadales bacterium]